MVFNMKKSSAQLTGVSALLLFLLAGASAAGADTFELRTGKNYEGAIMDEDTVNFYIDTPSDGVLSVRKVDVTTINGEPYQYMGQGTAPVKEGKPLPYLGYVSP